MQKFLVQIGLESEDKLLPSQFSVLHGLMGADAVMFNSMAQDLSWLQDVIAKKQAFGAAAHCLCDVKP
jgi:hypothetical protein